MENQCSLLRVKCSPELKAVAGAGDMATRLNKQQPELLETNYLNGNKNIGFECFIVYRNDDAAKRKTGDNECGWHRKTTSGKHTVVDVYIV